MPVLKTVGQERLAAIQWACKKLRNSVDRQGMNRRGISEALDDKIMGDIATIALCHYFLDLGYGAIAYDQIRNDNFEGESPNKDFGFVLTLAALVLFSLMGVGIDFDEYTQHQEINIPTSYFYFIFLVDLIMIASVVFIFFYKKIGVYIFPVALLTHFLVHSFFLSTFLYTDVTNMFLYVGVGLLAIIPKWQFFK